MLIQLDSALSTIERHNNAHNVIGTHDMDTSVNSMVAGSWRTDAFQRSVSDAA
jgi:hypothetical protein